jgi:hypothetical protein
MKKCHVFLLWNPTVCYCVDKSPSSSGPSVTFHNKLVIYSKLFVASAYSVRSQHCEVILYCLYFLHLKSFCLIIIRQNTLRMKRIAPKHQQNYVPHHGVTTQVINICDILMKAWTLWVQVHYLCGGCTHQDSFWRWGEGKQSLPLG